VETYAEENQRNLGYVTRDCRTVVSTEKRTRRELVKEHYATVDVQALNVSLLQGELETVTLNYDGRRITAQSTQNYNYANVFVSEGAFYNGSKHYTVTVSANRKRPAVKNRIVANASALTDDGTVTLVHPDYAHFQINREFNNKCDLYARVTVTAVNGGWFNREETVLGSREVKLELNHISTRVNFDVSNAIAKASRVEVKFTVRASDGCPFYSNQSSMIGSFTR